MAPQPLRRLAQRLRLVSERLRRLVRPVGDGQRLTRAQESALGWLERKGPQTTADLARAMQVRAQSMGATVHELGELGHVRKVADPDDQRREQVTLTAKGKAMVAEVAQARELALAALLEERLDAKQRAALGEALTLLEELDLER